MRIWLFVLLVIQMGACVKSTDRIVSTISQTQRNQAALQTADNNTACTSIAPFYWEIGDADGVIVYGTTGNGSVTSSTSMAVASASKLVFATYVVQKVGGTLTNSLIRGLNFTSGYSTFTSCASYTSVGDCYAGVTAFVTANNLKYYYGGGHMQKIAAVDLGLGSLGNAALATELQTYLGSDVSLSFNLPQPAGGLQMTAASYGLLLRKIVGGHLVMNVLLGENAVCTNTTSCGLSVSTPIPSSESWSYSLGHWVELDPVVGDGAFSSPGLYGFYPWINAERKVYGILARYSLAGSAYWDSVVCGRLIRKAYTSGQEQ